MERIYTFEHVDKATEQAHEHATIELRDGIITLLSQRVTEGAHMTRKWDVVGTYGYETDGIRWLAFGVRCFAIEVIAAGARQQWDAISDGVGDTHTVGRVNVLKCIRTRNGRLLTDPDSIRGHGRNKDAQADVRSKARKAVDMGEAMRQRVLERLVSEATK